MIATIFPAYDFARAVVGDDGSVSMLIKPGTEIHTYDPTAAVLRKSSAVTSLFTTRRSGRVGGYGAGFHRYEPYDLIRMMDAVTPVEEEKPWRDGVGENRQQFE